MVLIATGVVGKITIPNGLKFGTTKFGIAAHQEIEALLKQKYPKVEFTFRTRPGQTGVDVEVPVNQANITGWVRAEIKPNTASGASTLNNQLRNWGLGADDVQSITYDAAGNVTYGFH